MILSATIFGLAISEFVAVLGLLLAFIGGVVYIRTKLIEIELKVLEMEERITANEVKVEETAKDLKVETEKINDKLDQKINRLEIKLDHIIEALVEIKVNCAKVCGYKLDKKE